MLTDGRSDWTSTHIFLIISAIALVSLGWLLLRELLLKRFFGKNADFNVVVKALVGWVLVGVIILMIIDTLVG